MTAKRHVGRIAAALLTASLLTACGGSEDEPLVKPTSDSPSSSTPSVDAEGFTPEQREAVDAVTAWNTAAFSVSTDEIGPAIRDLVTPRVLDGVTAAEKDQKPSSYVGDVTMDVQKATIDGDSATVEACRDGSQAYRVDKGETKVGTGDTQVGVTQMTIGLVREDGRWLIDDPRGDQVTSC